MADFSVDSIASYANVPYAFNNLFYNNPNFMGVPPVDTNTEVSTNTPKNNVTPQATKEEKSSGTAGIIIGGLLTVGAAALLYKAHKKGGDKGILEGLKQIKNGILGKTTSTVKEGTEQATQAANNKIKAIMGADGKLVYTIPGYTKTISGENAIQDFANKYGIELKDLIKLKKDSKLNKYKFVFEEGGIKNTVSVKDGKIVDINNGTESILKNLENGSADDLQFLNRIQSKISSIENHEKAWTKGLTDVEWTTQIGDTSLRIYKANLTRNSMPRTMQLTTLDRLAADSTEVNAYFYRNPDAKALFTSADIAKGKLPKGMKIESYVQNFNADTKCHFKDGELVGITDISTGKYFAKGTDKCDAFLEKYSDVIPQMNKRLFKDNKIPTDINAVLMAA